jgi:hypothetical protein
MKASSYAAAVAAVAAVIGFGAAPVHAVPITVQNFSFEDPNVTTTFGATPTSWTRLTSGLGGGVFDPVAFGCASCGATFNAGVHLTQTLFSNGDDFSQVLASTLAVGTYTLTVALGDRNDTNRPISSIALGAGSATLVTTIAPAIVGAGTQGWQDFTATAVITAGNAFLGSNLRIDLTNLGNDIQVNFDNVRLDFAPPAAAAAPEPATLALLGLGLAGLAGFKRRKLQA